MKKTLKQKVREVISARNTLERMYKSKHYRNPIGEDYLNNLAVDVIDMAKKRHRLLPYYLVTRQI